MALPEVGDAITYISYGGCIVMSEVTSTNDISVSAAPIAYLSLSEEGKSWVRGWHNKYSDEGKALITAHALNSIGRAGSVGEGVVVSASRPWGYITTTIR